MFVQSLPAGNGKWQISIDGGTDPKWREDGRELFYAMNGQRTSRLMAVSVEITAQGLTAGTPVPLFEWARQGGTDAHYGVFDHGRRFLVPEQVPRPSTLLTLLLHWQDVLSR